jgi:hypothetical protein
MSERERVIKQFHFFSSHFTTQTKRLYYPLHLMNACFILNIIYDSLSFSRDFTKGINLLHPTSHANYYCFTICLPLHSQQQNKVIKTVFVVTCCCLHSIKKLVTRRPHHSFILSFATSYLLTKRFHQRSAKKNSSKIEITHHSLHVK